MPRQAVGWARRLRSTAASKAKSTRTNNNNVNETTIALFSSQAQVGEMLECADKAVDRPGRHLNFRALATDRGLPRPLSKFLDRNGPEKKRRTRKLSKCLVNGGTGGSARQGRDVFLGGSCNPTTWRKDKAIPLLESLSISYYNPQVGEWTSDLVAVEREAKDTARVLFYVLDRSTRNVVGMLEASNFASTTRSLVIVADSYLPGQPIANETISQTEFDELSDGLTILKDLLERRGVHVYSSIEDAVCHTSQLLRNKKQSGMCKVPSLPDKLDQVQVGDKFFALREVFNALDPKNCGKISLQECCKAYQRLTNKSLSTTDLKDIICNGSEEGTRLDHNSSMTLNFQQFCTMVNELKLRNGSSQKWSSCGSNLHSEFEYDVFVVSSSTDSWQPSPATISSFKSNDIRYSCAEMGRPDVNNYSVLDAIESSKTIVFLITSNTRGLSLMTMASYFLKLGSSVVLCIQELQEGCTINNEVLSKTAINDYNRGRVYLADEARRHGVKVLSFVDEALSTAIQQAIVSPS